MDSWLWCHCHLGDIFKTGTCNDCVVLWTLHPFQANKMTHDNAFELNPAYWGTPHYVDRKRMLTHFSGTTVSWSSGKSSNSCQHFCSLLD